MLVEYAITFVMPGLALLLIGVFTPRVRLTLSLTPDSYLVVAPASAVPFFAVIWCAMTS